MHVISLPQWRVLCFVNESGQNEIRQWLDRICCDKLLIGQFQGWIDMIEAAGPRAVPGCIVPVKKSDEFYSFKVERKGIGVIRPVLCYGPFSDREITLLVGVPDRSRDLLKPVDALSIAKHNLAELLRNPAGRKCYERIG